jgi:plasmid stability protein
MSRLHAVQPGDMSSTVVNVEHMSKMIQVRNVPDEVHSELKGRALAEGMSLSDFCKRELEVVTTKMSNVQMAQRFNERKGLPSSGTVAETVAMIREMRGD